MDINTVYDLLNITYPNYLYEYREYINFMSKIALKCLNCKKIYTQGIMHLLNNGPNCKCYEEVEKLHPNKRGQVNTEEIKKKIKNEYGERIDVNHVKYEKEKLIILGCRKHGLYRRKLSELNNICTDCKYLFNSIGNKDNFTMYYSDNSEYKKYSEDEILKLLKSCHGDEYDYSEMEFETVDKHIMIKHNLCEKKFMQLIDNHVKKRDPCPYCFHNYF